MAKKMSAYEAEQWNAICQYWERRANRRGLPNWVHDAGTKVAQGARTAGRGVGRAIPEKVKEPISDVAGVVMDKAMTPTIEGALRLLALVDDWAKELVDPQMVVKIAHKQGMDIDSFQDLREFDLKDCDRLLTRHTLQWRTFGAAEGAGMGAVAMIPVAGFPTSIALDMVAVQVLSVAIATRVAYSYGFDANDPQESEFIQQLVSGTFLSQSAKIKPLRDASRAADALKGRVKWSAKLRENHRLVAGLEKFMQTWYPKAGRVPVQHVSKAVPVVSVVVGAGSNAWALGNVAESAKRYSRTRFLCSKYGLEMPAALVRYGERREDGQRDAESARDEDDA